MARVVTSPRRRRLLLGGAGVALAGCSLAPDADHDGPDAPRPAPWPAGPGVAWVFSSGGPRGFVHVGVLKALQELGLRPGCLVGSSAGALVATLYGSSVPVDEIETLALELSPVAMARLAFGSSGGERFSGAPVAELVRRHARQPLLEQMPIPVACVALALPARTPVSFTAGDAGLAVQASAAIEGQFAPVRIRGMRYADADWLAPLPVRQARALGARKVLAVDASAHLDRAPAGAERYREADLRKRALVEADARLADLVIQPDFGYWVNLSRDFRERAIGAGYRETLAREHELRLLHQA